MTNEKIVEERELNGMTLRTTRYGGVWHHIPNGVRVFHAPSDRRGTALGPHSTLHDDIMIVRFDGARETEYIGDADLEQIVHDPQPVPTPLNKIFDDHVWACGKCWHGMAMERDEHGYPRLQRCENCATGYSSGVRCTRCGEYSTVMPLDELDGPCVER